MKYTGRSGSDKSKQAGQSTRSYAAKKPDRTGDTRSFAVSEETYLSREAGYRSQPSFSKPDEYDVFDVGTEESEKNESITPRGLGVLFLGALRPLTVFILSLAIVVAGLLIAYNYINDNFISPVDATDTSPVTVTIEKGSSLSKISDALEEAGVVQNATVFKFYTDFSDMSSKLKAGTFTLSRSMTMDDIILALSKGEPASTVTSFTVTEGQTVETMAESLAVKGQLTDKDAFLSLCRDGTEYLSYSFISDLRPITTDEVAEDDEAETTELTGDELAQAKFAARKYLLEGYLFPDTYEIYVGSDPDTMIRKMLDRFSQIMGEVYVNRAAELGMTVDEVVTLASVIEREGRPQDFKKISAVFHNRLGDGMKLESCATVQYLLSERKYNLTTEELETDSYYNTYKYAGLPAGPICSPGQAAIEAALYPDEQYVTDGYLYFCSGDPEQSELIFAKTYDEHLANQEKYRPLWEQYDSKYVK